MVQRSFDPARFTRSARAALRWAALRASLAAEHPASETIESESVAPASSSESEPAPVRVSDLLTGILLAHPKDSEPLQLLEHAGARPDRLDRLLEASGFRPSQPPEDIERPGLSPFPPMSPEAEEAVVRALELADRLNPESEKLVRLRDLFGGILLGTSEGPNLLRQALAGSQLGLNAVLETYESFLALDARSTTFGQYLQEHHPREAGDDRLRVALAIPDSITGEDLVGIDAEVDALAYLMASKDLQPPMAVGLFGDWGSGKSFFMEALRNRIDDITHAARESGLPQRDIAVYKSVIQIEFNAWHYVEGNLWASLVEHIFRNLKRSAREPVDLVEERQRYWIDKLETSRRELARVDARLKAMQSKKEAAEKALRAKRDELASKREELGQLQVQDLLAAVQFSDAEKATIDAALETMGVPTEDTTSREVAKALEDAREVLRRGNSLLSPILDGRKGFWWAVALAGAVVAGPALTLALTELAVLDLDGVDKIVTSLSGSLVALVGYLRKGTQWFSRALDRVEEAGSALDARMEETRKKLAADEARLREELEALQGEEQHLRRQGEAIQDDIEAIEAELRTITPGQILMDFIEDRVGSSDYRKHLGIAALIRRDFDRLARLVDQQNEQFKKSDHGENLEKEKQHLINRIVLYIDDLDRCPPRRVVDVLQAVHLLLAFPLFVVVVAVDSRWLSRSLLSHYSELLKSRDAAADGLPDRAAPDDYLEKIFQIPFNIRPLDEDARFRIVEGLLEDEEEDVGERAEESTEGAHGEPGGRETPEPGQPGEDEGEVEEADEGEAAPVFIDLSPESLRIRKEELEFMEATRPLLGRTPRAVKRFVNVYRLVKSISLARGDGFEPAEDGQIPGYQLSMFLLAVVTGLPTISGQIFRGVTDAIGGAGHRTLGELVEALSPENGSRTEIPRLRRWLETHDEGRWESLELAALAPRLNDVARFSFGAEVGLER